MDQPKSEPSSFVSDPQVRIGHVHLQVADIERPLKFYCGFLGLQLMQRFGPGAAFLSSGGNGVALYCDKAKEVWPRDSAGHLAMYTKPLDLQQIAQRRPARPASLLWPTQSVTECFLRLACEANRAILSAPCTRQLQQNPQACTHRPTATPKLSPSCASASAFFS
jgi:catechol-2,3-dioxygenase